MSLPAGTRRLFEAGLDVGPSSAFVVERLLEEGDSADLRWLVAHRGESALADWFGRQGGRRLSRRSRAFWALILDRAPPPEPASTSELWPL